uniref:Uncharacterized protein n=1 Tax=Haemonchus contortus TaxID=6289 RepID=A0A7I4YQD8_HAECO|nr:unnamed protein product [Haemonchus contortus]
MLTVFNEYCNVDGCLQCRRSGDDNSDRRIIYKHEKMARGLFEQCCDVIEEDRAFYSLQLNKFVEVPDH